MKVNIFWKKRKKKVFAYKRPCESEIDFPARCVAWLRSQLDNLKELRKRIIVNSFWRCIAGCHLAIWNQIQTFDSEDLATDGADSLSCRNILFT